MSDPFFDHPILNSPYECPQLHWGLDSSGQPTQEVIENRCEDAKEKATTMKTYWLPGVNHLGNHGRWAFAEFCDVYEIEADFATKVASQFNRMIESATAEPRLATS